MTERFLELLSSRMKRPSDAAKTYKWLAEGVRSNGLAVEEVIPREESLLPPASGREKDPVRLRISESALKSMKDDKTLLVAIIRQSRGSVGWGIGRKGAEAVASALTEYRVEDLGG